MSCSFCGGEDSFIYLVCERRHLICNSCLHQQTILKLFVDSLKQPPGHCPLCSTTIAGSLEQILWSLSGPKESSAGEPKKATSSTAIGEGHDDHSRDSRPTTPAGKGGSSSSGRDTAAVELVEVNLGAEECMFITFLKDFKATYGYGGVAGDSAEKSDLESTSVTVTAVTAQNTSSKGPRKGRPSATAVANMNAPLTTERSGVSATTERPTSGSSMRPRKGDQATSIPKITGGVVAELAAEVYAAFWSTHLRNGTDSFPTVTAKMFNKKRVLYKRQNDMKTKGIIDFYTNNVDFQSSPQVHPYSQYSL